MKTPIYIIFFTLFLGFTSPVLFIHFPLTGKEIVAYVRGEGCNDKGKTGKCGRAFIKVNGKDYSRHRKGFNFVVLNAVTGTLLYMHFLSI